MKKIGIVLLTTSVLITSVFAFSPSAKAIAPVNCGTEFSGVMPPYGIRDCNLNGMTTVLQKKDTDKYDFVIVDDTLIARNNRPSNTRFDLLISP